MKLGQVRGRGALLTCGDVHRNPGPTSRPIACNTGNTSPAWGAVRNCHPAGGHDTLSSCLRDGDGVPPASAQGVEHLFGCSAPAKTKRSSVGDVLFYPHSVDSPIPHWGESSAHTLAGMLKNCQSSYIVRLLLLPIWLLCASISASGQMRRLPLRTKTGASGTWWPSLLRARSAISDTIPRCANPRAVLDVILAGTKKIFTGVKDVVTMCATGALNMAKGALRMMRRATPTTTTTPIRTPATTQRATVPAYQYSLWTILVAAVTATVLWIAPTRASRTAAPPAVDDATLDAMLELFEATEPDPVSFRSAPEEVTPPPARRGVPDTPAKPTTVASVVHAWPVAEMEEAVALQTPRTIWMDRPRGASVIDFAYPALSSLLGLIFLYVPLSVLTLGAAVGFTDRVCLPLYQRIRRRALYGWYERQLATVIAPYGDVPRSPVREATPVAVPPVSEAHGMWMQPPMQTVLARPIVPPDWFEWLRRREWLEPVACVWRWRRVVDPVFPPVPVGSLWWPHR